MTTPVVIVGVGLGGLKPTLDDGSAAWGHSVLTVVF
jgi:hypothetical protein